VAGPTLVILFSHAQFLTALGRPVHIINLDPAVSNPPYPCSLSITDLITLDEVMDEHGLGPNGAILYCVEYLEANFDWLVEGLDRLLVGSGQGEKGGGPAGYVIFDTPGQVELWTNHQSLRRIIERLTKLDYRVSQRSLYVLRAVNTS
jgi:GTPase SAR1 family protein